MNADNVLSRWWYVRSDEGYYTELGIAPFRPNASEEMRRLESRLCGARLHYRWEVRNIKLTMTDQKHNNVRAVRVTVRRKQRNGDTNGTK